MNERMPTRAQANVSLSFIPSAELVSGVARVATDFCRLALKQTETASRIHLAVHELVENVIKYSTNFELSLDMEFEQQDDCTILKLSTKNRARAESLQQVVKLLTELKSADDPIAFYDRLLLEAAPKKVGSGIGLARIRAEADFEVDFEIEGDELKVFIQATVPNAEEASS